MKMTDITLREYVERILDERQRALELQFNSSQREIDAASKALGTRLESMNEFRKQIDEERALYVKRDRLDALESNLAERIKVLETSAANMTGRLWAAGVALTAAWAALLRFGR